MTPAQNAHLPIVLFGVPFHRLTFASTLDWIDRIIAERTPSLMATANLDFLCQAAHDPLMKQILFEADAVVADGQPIVRCSRFTRAPLPERVTGSDLTPLIAEHAAKKGHRLFLLGGAPGVAEKTAALFVNQYPGLQIAGHFCPEKADLANMNHAEILSRIHDSQPDILLVAFGAPKQEKWIHMHLSSMNVPVSIGIGGSLDFLVGAQQRAPRWMQHLGLEWLGRLLSDPARLTRRYFNDGRFLLHQLFQLALLRMRPVAPYAHTISTSELSEKNLLHINLPLLTSPEQAEQLRPELFKNTHLHHLLITCDHTDWLNSIELGVIVQLANTARRHGHQAILLPPSKRTIELARFQGLHTLLHLASSPDEAHQYIRSIINRA